MNNSPNHFIHRLNTPVLLAAILILIVIQALIRIFIPSFESYGPFIDIVFNVLLSGCLGGLFIKKYNPSSLRISILIFFLVEFIVGIFLKQKHISYSREIIFIGFLGILILWINTYQHHKKTGSYPF